MYFINNVFHRLDYKKRIYMLMVDEDVISYFDSTG